MSIVNITVENDADFYCLFLYQMSDGTPINIGGLQMLMMLRRHAKDDVAVMRLGTDTGEIAFVDPANGKFSVRISQYDLERLGLGSFDHSLVASDSAGYKRSIWTGTLTNNPGPSR